MGPMQIAGATFGLAINRCLPVYMIMALLVLLLLATAYKTVKQVLRLRKQSQLLRQQQKEEAKKKKKKKEEKEAEKKQRKEVSMKEKKLQGEKDRHHSTGSLGGEEDLKIHQKKVCEGKEEERDLESCLLQNGRDQTKEGKERQQDAEEEESHDDEQISLKEGDDRCSSETQEPPLQDAKAREVEGRSSAKTVAGEGERNRSHHDEAGEGGPTTHSSSVPGVCTPGTGGGG